MQNHNTENRSTGWIRILSLALLFTLILFPASNAKAAEPVVLLLDTSESYSSLPEAIEAAAEKGLLNPEFSLLSDVTLEKDSCQIYYNCSLDLNGHTLTINDSLSGNRSEDEYYTLTINYSDLEEKGAIILGKEAQINLKLLNYSSCDLTMNGGFAQEIEMYGQSAVTINGGKLYRLGLYSAKATISGASINELEVSRDTEIAIKGTTVITTMYNYLMDSIEMEDYFCSHLNIDFSGTPVINDMQIILPMRLPEELDDKVLKMNINGGKFAFKPESAVIRTKAIDDEVASEMELFRENNSGATEEELSQAELEIYEFTASKWKDAFERGIEIKIDPKAECKDEGEFWVVKSPTEEPEIEEPDKKEEEKKKEEKKDDNPSSSNTEITKPEEKQPQTPQKYESKEETPDETVNYQKVKTLKATTVKATINEEAPSFTKASLKKAKKLKSLTLKKATAVSFAKNATKKAKKLKKITAKKVVKAANVKFAKGSLKGLPKSCKIIFSKNMSKEDQAAVKKAAKNAGFKGKVQFK
ncbi:MAG: hypothetical protein K5739_04535 [Lachnospiraceae bacterium]|nr:hypothetical protein [Lachnospiraceae bacterium]